MCTSLFGNIFPPFLRSLEGFIVLLRENFVVFCLTPRRCKEQCWLTLAITLRVTAGCGNASSAFQRFGGLNFFMAGRPVSIPLREFVWGQQRRNRLSCSCHIVCNGGRFLLLAIIPIIRLLELFLPFHKNRFPRNRKRRWV